MCRGSWGRKKSDTTKWLNWTEQKTQNTQSNLKKEEKAGNISLPYFKLYYKEIIIKKVTVTVISTINWHKNRHIDQNRIKNPEINPHKYSQFMTKEWRIYNGERIASSFLVLGKRDSLMQKMKLDHCLTPYIKFNSKID